MMPLRALLTRPSEESNKCRVDMTKAAEDYDIRENGEFSR